MQALDTNVLVRLLVNDDAAQAAKARALLDARVAEDGAFWIGDTVLVELVWTLSRAYDRKRAEIAAALRALACNATLALESPAAVHQALSLYEAGPADFADCLLATKAALAGCVGVRTFDRKMRVLPGVTAP